MDFYLAALQGQALYEERLREARQARRFLTAKRVSELPTLMRALLLIFL